MPDQPDKPRSPYVVSRGIKFPKDGKFITGMIRGSLKQGSYEAKEADVMLKVVRDGDTVIELGAGIGFMSSYIAANRKVNAVHSFEANPHLIPLIRQVHQINGLENTHITNAILGPRKGKVDFHVSAKLLESTLSPVEGSTYDEVVKVDVLNANKVLRDTGANMLVCDIEGAEVDLIPKLDLSNIRAAVIELHPQWIGPEGVNAVFRAFMDGGLAYYARGSTQKVVSFRRNW